MQFFMNVKNIILCSLMLIMQSASSMYASFADHQKASYEEYKRRHTSQEVRLYDRYKNPCCKLEASLNIAINDTQESHPVDKCLGCPILCFIECCMTKCGKPERSHASLVKDVANHRSLNFRSPVTFGKAPVAQRMQ